MSLQPSTIWTDQLKAHLDLAIQVARRCPAGEFLQPTELNNVLEKIEELHSMFLLMCELQGFKTQPKQ